MTSSSKLIPAKRKKKNKKNEGDKLIDLTQSDNFVQTCVFDKDSYSSFNYLPHMLTDLKRFCVDSCSPYIVDTTFQVAEKIWLTTSCYENEALIDCNGNHPHLPGPCQWQFC